MVVSRTLTTVPMVTALSAMIGEYAGFFGISHTWPSCRRMSVFRAAWSSIQRHGADDVGGDQRGPLGCRVQ